MDNIEIKRVKNGFLIMPDHQNDGRVPRIFSDFQVAEDVGGLLAVVNDWAKATPPAKD